MRHCGIIIVIGMVHIFISINMSFRNICLILFLVEKAIAGTNCPNIVTRDEWGARPAIEVTHLIIPVEYVIIQHTVTPECTTKSACIDRVFNTQVFHMENENLEYDDIAYNFLIGSDGNVYQGTGWNNMGSHTYGYNSKSIGIGFIGTYDDKNATPAAIEAVKKLLECGVAQGKLDKHYKLLAARQVSQTKSPGLRLYRELKTWRGWRAVP